MIQLQVLNYLLETKDLSFLEMNNLDKEYFSDYETEYTFIKTFVETYNKIPDKETFIRTFPNFEFFNVSETTQYLITELTKDRNTRHLANTFNKVRDLLLNNNLDKAVSLYQNAVDNLKSNVALSSVDIIKDTTRYDRYIDKTKDINKYFVTTGFKELDDVIGGWDRLEELATIVARTNQGKSWILLKSALAAAQKGLTVGIYSGEMSEDLVGYRIDTLLCHLSNTSLVRGNENIMNDYKRYIDDLPNNVKGAIKVLTPKMINGPAGVKALRLFIEKDKLDILFVDQHSLLEDDRKGRTDVDKASNVSKDLKNLQVMKQIPIISVSQQNRTKVEDGVPDTTTIARADRIGQDSTTIIFLERDKDKDLAKLHLVKSRNSRNGIELDYKVDLNIGEFYYIPKEDDTSSVSKEDLTNFASRYDLGESEENVF